MRRLVRSDRLRGGEDGFALPAVLGIAMVVMLLVATMVATSTSGARVTAKDTAWLRAAAAAQAGIADYQARLNADNSYGLYGQASAPFSRSTGSTFPSGTGSNPAFAYERGGDSTWVWVPGADGKRSDAAYRYAVDNSKLGSQGLIRLQVTGKSGTTSRTFIANIRPDGFSNYLYYTNYESGKPSVTNETYSNRSSALCSSAYQPLATSTTCAQIQFGPNDRLQGPVRSNDRLMICGSTFDSTVQSVYSYTTSGCSTSKKATFAQTPTTTSTLTPPATIGNLRDYARTDLPSTTETVEGVGCLYTGPTKITFNGNGTMTVQSPMTIATQVQGQTASAGAVIVSGSNGNSAKCGTVAALQGAGATVPIPTNNIVYVQNEPAQRSGSTQDPNYWDASAFKNKQNACDVAASPVTNQVANGVGFPYVSTAGSSTMQKNNSEITPTAGGGANVSNPYGCDRGDVFVQGVVDKAVTIAAENYLYVTGDITYPANRTASTVLGLIGQEAVWVWNPFTVSGVPAAPTAGDDRRIDASILSNAGTFVVQNWTKGSTAGRGQLTVNGSIAQNWRGAVGLASGTGYSKDYQYDSSLRTYTPPKFPQPTITTYTVATQVESKTAYDASGAAL
ncbi:MULTISPECIES: hypothetical protein [unclassified Curtobacterium]|uniref:hypothetical protein n=1 Tax=unclassified Curtobacterium TaxID=257496 RepID=UPI0008DCF066|nr:MULTISPECIES: hypothetical protein [unclassified Curtobacterium]OIH99425.1 hypothetical protein BIU92_00515 [Curtobacterium sp. MCBA15_003]OII11329.1 hypothetical protein BIU97_05315 [Curtobacterium sp. MCBA15_009]OII30744.1 hypothetical protein BIU94_08380 [Curtobacterium sp. MMLR14_006]